MIQHATMCLPYVSYWLGLGVHLKHIVLDNNSTLSNLKVLQAQVDFAFIPWLSRSQGRVNRQPSHQADWFVADLHQPKIVHDVRSEMAEFVVPLKKETRDSHATITRPEQQQARATEYHIRKSNLD